MTGALADRIDAILPQTQCTKCGYEGCRPYAEAIAAGEAAINRCPPGGALGIAKLAALTGAVPAPLDADCGSEGPLQVARIDASLCIGCTKCIAACPVDAIIGAARRMHTVAEALCSGCDLCVPACPVDCISMAPPRRRATLWSAGDAAAARERFERRRARLQSDSIEQDRRLERHAVAPAATAGQADKGARPDEGVRADEGERPAAGVQAVKGAAPARFDGDRRRALIDAAVRRARERLAAGAPR
ncbi:RnfABCDGE type electron transport complex subunit B [Quisquiliibacterium transsilvanicum]|uniref:Electron transport complex protein RnfB n=1 Tax=Quisquiliibacterium transsilvanicum TaxID=1549638 RepID=A0A7W8M7V9_9BURK|nr:RnfABCDGE type electron transport complex subunit B [Quisquiliibacterium transsilvanicum]MBB5270987.1 electron transport complex protein RnfB [Quisquiliibacterium transsilvanicum]